MEGNGLDRLRVVVAICTQEPPHLRTMACLSMMAQVFEHAEYNGEKELDILPVYGEIMPELRHRAVCEAAARDATHLLWLGHKMLFPPDALNYMLGLKLPVVAANYSENSNLTSTRPTAYVETDDYVGPLYTEKDSQGLQEVIYCGLGFMLCEMGVFGEDVFPELPYFQYEAQPPKFLRFTGDNVFFCRKVRAAEVPIYVSHDLSKDVHQVGDHVYTVEDAARLKSFTDKKTDQWADQEKAKLIGPRDEMVQEFLQDNIRGRLQ